MEEPDDELEEVPDEDDEEPDEPVAEPAEVLPDDELSELDVPADFAGSFDVLLLEADDFERLSVL